MLGMKYLPWVLMCLPFSIAAQESAGPVAGGDDTATVAVQKHLVRSAFTRGIQNNEPIDILLSLSNQYDKVYYFTELQGMEGQVITHRWEYEGQQMADVSFSVGGPRWRVWSSKYLLPQWTGEWKVRVLDSQGNELGSDVLQYTPAALP